MSQKPLAAKSDESDIALQFHEPKEHVSLQEMESVTLL